VDFDLCNKKSKIYLGELTWNRYFIVLYSNSTVIEAQQQKKHCNWKGIFFPVMRDFPTNAEISFQFVGFFHIEQSLWW